MAVVPVNSSLPVTISSTLEISRTNLPLSNIMPGETLALSVIEKISLNKYLLTLKDVSFTATSEIPLKAGDKLLVKVQNVHPQIILNLVDGQKQNTDAKINESLLQWRSSPESLGRLLSQVAEFSALVQSGDLPPGITQKDIDSLMKIFTHITYSSETKTNPLFVKDFVSSLGLLLENDLAKMVSRSLKDGAQVLTENLKASLLKLSAAVTEALKDAPKLDSHATARLVNLSLFTAEALKTIEARQAVNVIYQQNESGLYLQIPLAMGGMLRQADIFITPDDKNADAPAKYSSCSVMVFLDMDYLGEISIDASLKEGRIRCVIKCENEEITELVRASGEKLKAALEGIGYGIERIDCLQATELRQKRSDYIEQQILGSMDLVNRFA